MLQGNLVKYEVSFWCDVIKNFKEKLTPTTRTHTQRCLGGGGGGGSRGWGAPPANAPPANAPLSMLAQVFFQCNTRLGANALFTTGKTQPVWHLLDIFRDL
jgi:hypothetical protein